MLLQFKKKFNCLFDFLSDDALQHNAEQFSSLPFFLIIRVDSEFQRIK